MRDETLDDYLERNNLFLCRELTDEEIEEVIGRHWNKEYGNRNMLTLCRAVLRKAQEK